MVQLTEYGGGLQRGFNPVKRFYEFIQRRDKESKEDGEPRSSATGNFVEEKEYERGENWQKNALVWVRACEAESFRQ